MKLLIVLWPQIVCSNAETQTKETRRFEILFHKLVFI